jgi:sugar O-acyltransferase (sialic acid O-acetyltransferase NeuD family)
MVIAGAKGFAKEVLEIFAQQDRLDNIYFFDNVSKDLPEKLYDRFPVIQSLEDVRKTFEKTGDYTFSLGLGNPAVRYKMDALLTGIGGQLTSVISPFAHIGHFGNFIAPGCCIMTGTVITNDIKIGRGSLINLNCTIGHDSELGDFVEMSPDVNISGNCKIGSFCNLGTNAVLLPHVTMGKNVVAGAGSVITKDVPDNSLVVGIPGVIKKELPPLSFS